MAYATIAGLPVEVGLYTAFLPLLVYALLGTSRPLSVTTTSTIAALTAVAVASVSPAMTEDEIEAVATLGVLTGAILLAAGVFRDTDVTTLLRLPDSTATSASEASRFGLRMQLRSGPARPSNARRRRPL